MSRTRYREFHTGIDWGNRRITVFVRYRYYRGARATYLDPEEAPELEILSVRGPLGPAPTSHMNPIEIPDGEIDMGEIIDEAWQHAREE